MQILSTLLLTLLFFAQCQTSLKQKENNPAFVHDNNSGPTPWTSTDFELEEEYFTFAIISDLTGGEREGVYNTAVAQLNRLDPTFVLSVGDLIEGATEDTLQLIKEWDSFDKRTSYLNMPFFHLGGNHDLTNPTMRKVWQNRYGNTYYHFVYENVLFLMLDSEDFGEERMLEIYHARTEAMKIIRGEVEGNFEETEYYNMFESKVGGMSVKQFQYFENVLNKYPNVKWTFVLMHKPLWMREDEKGLGRLEKVLDVETS
ncbi:MAG: metallophosphoesterase [Fulvivirga sp.]|uniref:metallophosphoesterase family protein n=1 Tax=Fulvivirga sp. TaxID=1931237 RepID=UPI0032EACCF9